MGEIHGGACFVHSLIVGINASVINRIGRKKGGQQAEE